MMQLGFDGELKGSDDKVLPVFCEVQQPYVGGQKTQIRVAVPAQFISSEPPANACTLSGKCGAFTVNMQGVHWRCFPTSSRSNHGLEAIELLHVERLTVTSPSMSDQTEFQFHLGPVSYLREEYSNHAHGDKSGRQNLLVVDHPRLGGIRFVTDWVTLYNRASESFGATLVGGICAIVNLPASTPMDEEKIVAEFKSSLEVLSLLFRQAVVLHGWTYSRNNQTITTWVAPMDPIVTPTFREERGDLVAPPQDIVQYASELTHAYATSAPKIKSLIRHLLVAINPYSDLRNSDHFLSMFTALERVIEAAMKLDSTPCSPAASNDELISRLQGLIESVKADAGECADVVTARLDGFIKTVHSGVSWSDKFASFLRAYPEINHCRADLWPVIGRGQQRGLKEIRNALAHGRGPFISTDVIAVAKWHLAILMERLVFVLLGASMPEGIRPNSSLLRYGGRGWYESDFWTPLQSKPDQSI